MMARMRLAFAALFVLALTACGGGGSGESAQKAGAPSSQPADSASPSSTSTSKVEVVVILHNVLDQSCEALTGVHEDIHTGAVVTLEDSSSSTVGQARLGPPPQPALDSACAWGATIDAAVAEDGTYTAVVADRFVSEPTSASTFATRRIVINAS